MKIITFWHQQSTRIVKCKRFPWNETKIPISHNFQCFHENYDIFNKYQTSNNFPQISFNNTVLEKEFVISCCPNFQSLKNMVQRWWDKITFFSTFYHHLWLIGPEKREKRWMYMFWSEKQIFVTIYSTFKQGSSANENLRWLSWFGKKLVWRIFD